MSIRETIKSITTFGASDYAPLTMNGNGAHDSYALAALQAPPLSWQWERPSWPTWDPYKGAQSYSKLALVYRCVNIVAHALGTATIRVYDEANDNEEVEDHPLRLLMKRPNKHMGEAAFWSHVGTRTATAGFCVVEKERNRAGSVIGLHPLQSAWLKAKLRRDGTYDWEYRVPGVTDPFPLKAEDVLRFTWADTATGSPYGIGPVEACLREVTLNNELIDFVKTYVERGAVPVHGLIPDPATPEMTQEEVEVMLDSFVARRGGLRNASRPMYLQAIKEIVTLGNSLSEMAYTELRDLNELGIVQAFGIPASVAQIRVGLQHSDSRANAEVDEAKLYRQTIIPLWGRFDDALTLGLLDEFEPDGSTRSLQFDTSDITALQEDRNAKAERLNPAVAGGWLSVHAWHRELGLPVPDGDDYYLRSIAVEAVPISEPIPEPEPTPPALRPFTGEDDEDDNTGELALSSPLLALRATTQSAGYQRRYARAQSSRKLIEKVADARVASIRAFFTAQGKRLIPQVTANTLALQDINWADEEDALERIIRQLYEMAGTTAFGVVSSELGIDLSFNLANPNLAAVRQMLAQRVKGITEETRFDIQRIVTDSLQEGVDMPTLRDRLTGLFDETYRNRSMTIARTESQVSFNSASAVGYRESGVVDRIQCFDSPTHCDDYGASDGLSCCERNGLIDTLESAEAHIQAEHPNGTLAIAGVLIGEDG